MGMPDRLIQKIRQRRFSPLDLIDKAHLIEKVLTLTLSGRHGPERGSPHFAELLEDFNAFHTEKIRTVVFGGGSGLSSILGGDSRTEGWQDKPFPGLKSIFKDLKVGVCTTDDGGSTGLILKHLEIIAVGDLRKVCLSMVVPDNLKRLYGLQEKQCLALAGLLKGVMNHRFSPDPGTGSVTRDAKDVKILLDPMILFDPEDRLDCPEDLRKYFSRLGRYLLDHPALGVLPLKGNCLGNLYLVASMYRLAPGGSDRPGSREVLKGIQDFGTRIGAPRGSIFPATTTPGQLRFLYGNGVAVYGQNKALVSRRGYPVERVSADYIKKPRVDPRLLRAIRNADLILFAPGSVFSSLMPILQIEAITAAIRANDRAVKVLAASFWVQEGETDVTRRGPGARYSVSDMIEAYNRNVLDGLGGVFNQILVADLKQLPGHVLRNYALQGKIPIFLDRDRVKHLGFEAIEAPVFAREMLDRHGVLHHDPERFALAVKTLLYMKGYLKKPGRQRPWREEVLVGGAVRGRFSPARYMAHVQEKIDGLDLRTEGLRRSFRDLLWRNRDILPEHLDQFVGIKVIPVNRWKRSTEWDKVLGYFDPQDRYLKIHQQLMRGDPERLQEDILIGMGEALLGRYFREKRLAPLVVDGERVGKIYSIHLAPERERHGFLKDGELRTYLGLAKMRRSTADKDVYRIILNGDEGFMAPGLLFGLLYAWYLNNQYGGVADYEMSMVRWNVSDLIPHQTQEMIARRDLIAFFRTVVFRHVDREVESILAAARKDSRRD